MYFLKSRKHNYMFIVNHYIFLHLKGDVAFVREKIVIFFFENMCYKYRTIGNSKISYLGKLIFKKQGSDRKKFVIV